MESTFNSHTGLVIYDFDKQKLRFEYNSHKYFTPASNTKVFTFFTALKTLPDSIPALRYKIIKDSLLFCGTGDPTFLYDKLSSTKALQFLKSAPQSLYFTSTNNHSQHFGPGWAWDDYTYRFSSEKSPFPIYGNTISIKRDIISKKLKLNSPIFKKYFWLGDTLSQESIYREYGSNHTTYFPSPSEKGFEKKIPFHYDDNLLVELLGDTLKRKVKITKVPVTQDWKTIYSVPSDSVYKQMMVESDNFVAEQLLLMCGMQLFDSLNTKATIEYIQEKYFKVLPDPIIWKDGSGLSRYNLVTPRSMVSLWNWIYQEVPSERLFRLLAVGGESGTLKNWYKSERPYIFGKTGTLSNNHALSGFLTTKKGKIFIFGFMNNNFPVPSSKIKEQMERILWEIHLHN